MDIVEVLKLLMKDPRISLIGKSGDGSDWINSYKRIVPVNATGSRSGIGYVMFKDEVLHIHFTKGEKKHFFFGDDIYRHDEEDIIEMLNKLLEDEN